MSPPGCGMLEAEASVRERDVVAQWLPQARSQVTPRQTEPQLSEAPSTLGACSSSPTVASS